MSLKSKPTQKKTGECGSFDADDARMTALHVRWMMDAIQSGPTQPLRMADMDAAFENGIRRAKARRKCS